MSDEKTGKPKGRVVHIRKVNKETGKIEETPFWVEGDDVFAIEKKNKDTGEWEKPMKEVEPPSKEDMPHQEPESK